MYTFFANFPYQKSVRNKLIFPAVVYYTLSLTFAYWSRLPLSCIDTPLVPWYTRGNTCFIHIHNWLSFSLMGLLRDLYEEWYTFLSYIMFFNHNVLLRFFLDLSFTFEAHGTCQLMPQVFNNWNNFLNLEEIVYSSSNDTCIEIKSSNSLVRSTCFVKTSCSVFLTVSSPMPVATSVLCCIFCTERDNSPFFLRCPQDKIWGPNNYI
jgi:hypothetical protein